MWSNPGGVDFAAFTGHAQLYANIVLSCRRDLEGWNDATCRELKQWCDFMEQLYEDMTPADKAQAQRYLADPLSFASTGHDERALAVCRAGLNVKCLGAASHFMLRALLTNRALCCNLVLFKEVIRTYLDMIDGPEDVPNAVEVMAKDLAKEGRAHYAARIMSEWLERWGPMILAEQLPRLSPRCVYDEEVRYFIRPQSVKNFALSRALAPMIVDLAFCEQCVAACRKCPSLLEVLLLATVPRPLYLTFAHNRSRDHLGTFSTDLLLSCVLKSQSMLSLSNVVDPFVLVQVAALSPPFRQSYLEHCSDE
jgi:hypothetical protein